MSPSYPHHMCRPRVLAATLMFPVIVTLAITVGLISGWLTSITLLELSTQDFIKGLRQFYEFKDIWFGLVKSTSFGAAISFLGCMKGLTARGGAEGVGLATTQAVVAGAAMILVLDAIWAVFLL